MRAKYLDWCSARIAERFVRLTPDQIYELAQRAKGSDTDLEGSEPGSKQELSYRSVVERVTEALSLELKLPTYEEWSAAYAEAPERFEDELLGFWREDA